MMSTLQGPHGIHRVTSPPLEWLSAHWTEVRERYDGRWIAVGPDGGVGVGADRRSAREEAIAAGLAHPLLIRVNPLAFSPMR